MRISALLLAGLITCNLASAPNDDDRILRDIAADRYVVAGGHHCYVVPPFHDTPAPKGFKAVYVSHAGRHGSRLNGTGPYEKILPVLDSLHDAGALTPAGDSLRGELKAIFKISSKEKGVKPMLTPKGAAEHRGIAARLYRRVPEVFSQRWKDSVACFSSPVPRVVASMDNFSGELLRLKPGLKLSKDSGVAFGLYHLDLTPASKSEFKAAIAHVQDSIVAAFPYSAAVSARLRNDAVSFSRRNIFDIFESAQISTCLDDKLDPLRWFSAEDLFEYFKYREMYFGVMYGPMDKFRKLRASNASKLALMIVRRADLSLAGGNHCADLRFGHDGDLGPLCNLLQIGDYRHDVKPGESWNTWVSWKNICMGVNLQFIFYSNGNGRTLVKALLNEKETTIGDLKPVSGPYYEWSDVRDFIFDRALNITAPEK